MKSILDNIPDAGSRYTLSDILGQGVFGTVYNALDTEASNKLVAIKIQKYNKDTKCYVEEEYEVLKELSNVIYLVGFYGIFKTDKDIWFVLENCEGRTANDLVNGLLEKNRRIPEEHLAYILKEVVKALIYLHEHHIIHRDIKGSNILITKEGEIKLCDFGLSKKLKDKDEKLSECIGSPSWMAPEVITANSTNSGCGIYDNRVDVWGLGITAIELAEGKAPFQNMHPSRALFQIVKNPPPSLVKVSNWSENLHDFISECLVKFFEHRPYIMEVIDHPFLQQIPENNYHLSLEVKTLLNDIGNFSINNRPPEVAVIGKYVKSSSDCDLDKILEEDFANLEDINENSILELIENRFNKEEYYSFIGDILLSINPNERLQIYGKTYHQKYFGKSRSDNAPHIYAIADTAYQNALHHKTIQQIVLTGESASGKTSNYLHIVDHLFFISEQHPVSVHRIKNGIKLIHALTHAGTPTNDYSTRCVLKTELAFGQTGKLTAAAFKASCLEKWRISAVDMNQCNFHILYYIYDGLVHHDANEKYKLDSKRNYRYLRIPANQNASTDSIKPRDNIEQNVIKYKKIFSYLEEFEFSEEQITTFFSVIAAILNLGELRFQYNEEDGSAILENGEYAEKFSELMEIDEKKFIWALTNYCLVKRGNVIKRKNTCDEARDSRDVLANILFNRFVDYVVGLINDKLAMGKAIFGEKYTIRILDFFGFECFKQNHLPQFLVNCLNEQLQFHYLQRIFAWESQDLYCEEMEFKPLNYFDNRKTLNQLLSKPEGVLCFIDEAAKRHLDGRYIMDHLQNQESNRVMISNIMEFSVAHYTGIVAYTAKEMADKNRDFLPPEIIETMGESENPIIRNMFTNKLDRTGNLILNFERGKRIKNNNHKKMVDGANQFSQIKNMRTAGTVFRYFCLDLLKELSVGGSSGGTHFVRCIRSNLKGKPRNFHKELVKQQLRALTVVETAKIRQKGYPQRISFPEFLRRYKFLAFDFNENVEITKENCRLLLIRLKMEGWAIGKSKVFLKYYNEEYLSRLYETQVKKIIKIQSILRGFLTKCRLKKKDKEQEKVCIEEIKKRRRSSVMTPDEAAEIIQKAYRRTAMKNKGLENFSLLSESEIKLIKPYAKKWKSRSIYQVLLQYRSAKQYDLFNFSLQVHLYNQKVFFHIFKIQKPVDLDNIDRKANVNIWLGEIKPVVQKVFYNLKEIPFYDTSALCDPLTNVGGLEDCWDSPYQWREHKSGISQTNINQQNTEDHLISLPYSRDPEETLATLPENISENKFKKDKNKCAVKKSPVKRYESIGKQDFKEKQEIISQVNLRKTDKSRHELKESTYNSAPANEDFKYIKSGLIARPKNADPVAELKDIAPRRDSGSDDEPPFNFQGMLRKTNFQRDSIKKSININPRRESLKNTALEAVRRFSLPKDKDDQLINGDKATVINSRPVFMELVPGLILEGVEVDLKKIILIND